MERRHAHSTARAREYRAVSWRRTASGQQAVPVAIPTSAAYYPPPTTRRLGRFASAVRSPPPSSRAGPRSCERRVAPPGTRGAGGGSFRRAAGSRLLSRPAGSALGSPPSEPRSSGMPARDLALGRGRDGGEHAARLVVPPLPRNLERVGQPRHIGGRRRNLPARLRARTAIAGAPIRQQPNAATHGGRHERLDRSAGLRRAVEPHNR